MMNARLFERASDGAEPPYLGAGGQRGAFVNPVDVVQFYAWVEHERQLKSDSQRLLEELQRVGQHGFTETELAREKVNLLSSAGERRIKSASNVIPEIWPQLYVDHFHNGYDDRSECGIRVGAISGGRCRRSRLADVDELADSWALNRQHGVC